MKGRHLKTRMFRPLLNIEESEGNCERDTPKVAASTLKLQHWLWNVKQLYGLQVWVIWAIINNTNLLNVRYFQQITTPMLLLWITFITCHVFHPSAEKERRIKHRRSCDKSDFLGRSPPQRTKVSILTTHPYPFISTLSPMFAMVVLGKAFAFHLFLVPPLWRNWFFWFLHHADWGSAHTQEENIIGGWCKGTWPSTWV